MEASFLPLAQAAVTVYCGPVPGWFSPLLMMPSRYLSTGRRYISVVSGCRLTSSLTLAVTRQFTRGPVKEQTKWTICFRFYISLNRTWSERQTDSRTRQRPLGGKSLSIGGRAKCGRKNERRPQVDHSEGFSMIHFHKGMAMSSKNYILHRLKSAISQIGILTDANMCHFFAGMN